MRLVTRADLDGLACARMLMDHEPFDALVLVHPQDITDKRIEIFPEDTLANLPYHPNCGRWFDHHLLTESNEKPAHEFVGLYRQAPSAAELVWEFLGREPRYQAMVEETSRFDSGQLTEQDVLQPSGWVLLGFCVDPRTGHGDREVFFRRCLQWIADRPIEEVLIEPEVRERIIRMFEQNEDFCWELVQRSRLAGNVVFTDFRGVAQPAVGNRFLVYTLFPESNVSVRAQFTPDKQAVMVNVGHSIFNRSCRISVGELMSEYGGGGHFGAGSAPLPILDADKRLLEIIERLQDARA
jgi:hypothetical protein